MKKSDSFDEKWGEETAKHGWVGVPTTLFFAQQALGINALELNVLLNLIMHWWNKEKSPYPSQAAIARRMGVSVRTVQRTLDDLVEKQLIEKQRSSIHNPVFKGRNVYNLSPLVHHLKMISIDLKLD
ncbi:MULTISPECIES: helix-turn-helix domain-containing protein [Acinetobacter]|uniref:helix-turn-helix domain-containing protein n=1 Tax=Acinetobacter TaxID=469 RepID=UPI001D195026|nr:MULTISPECIES: helix-turn-helix domain-containing protein [Acinetobacter]MCQ1100364.1 helix-turn-helix domain-containing protein [Acinetobacter baumannii]